MKMLLAEPSWMRMDTVTADDRWEFCLRGRGTEHAGKEVVRLKRNSAKVGQNGRETELEEGCLCDYFIWRKSVRVTLLPGSILSLLETRPFVYYYANQRWRRSLHFPSHTLLGGNERTLPGKASSLEEEAKATSSFGSGSLDAGVAHLECLG